MKVNGLRAWNTNADNLEDMVRFYKEVLGAKEAITHTVGGVTVSRLSLGESTIGIFDASGGPGPACPTTPSPLKGRLTQRSW